MINQRGTYYCDLCRVKIRGVQDRQQRGDLEVRVHAMLVEEHEEVGPEVHTLHMCDSCLDRYYKSISLLLSDKDDYKLFYWK